jgi:peptidoglycan-N-acetylglucosamine deacetylase
MEQCLRLRTDLGREQGNVPGKARQVLEIPVNWHLDNFPPLAYIISGVQAGMQDSGTILQRCQDIFDYAQYRIPSTCYAVAMHPQIIGQAHHLMWFERVLEYISSKDGVWYATCAETRDAGGDDEDRRLMEMEDVRGVEQAPIGSGYWRSRKYCARFWGESDRSLPRRF